MRKYPDVLRPSLVMCPPPKHDVVHHIETRAPPTHGKRRRLADDKLKVAKQEFERMFQAGIVQLSSSEWASPLHLVAKADRSYRACGD